MARVVMRIVVGDSEADQTREVLRDLAYRVHTGDPGQSAGVEGFATLDAGPSRSRWPAARRSSTPPISGRIHTAQFGRLRTSA